jgi:hypothetical protein
MPWAVGDGQDTVDPSDQSPGHGTFPAYIQATPAVCRTRVPRKIEP